MGSHFLPLALILYIIGIFLAFAGTVHRSGAGRAGSIGALSVAWVLELLSIGHEAMALHSLPITNLAQFLLVLSWAILTSYLVVWLRWKVHALGLVLPPIAALAAFASLQDGSGVAAAPDLARQRWFLFHTASSTAGLAILCLAFAMALIYLVKDRALKSKRTPDLLSMLPSLDSCDRIGLLALALGFLLLSVGIATGVLINASVHHRLLAADAKQTFPVLAWIVFAVILFSRTMLGFRGRKSALLTIAGFTLGLMTVLGIAF
jgi:ABC-type uncharacterized transport system permease subunit